MDVYQATQSGKLSITEWRCGPLCCMADQKVITDRGINYLPLTIADYDLLHPDDVRLMKIADTAAHTRAAMLYAFAGIGRFLAEKVWLHNLEEIGLRDFPERDRDEEWQVSQLIFWVFVARLERCMTSIAHWKNTMAYLDLSEARMCRTFVYAAWQRWHSSGDWIKLTASTFLIWYELCNLNAHHVSKIHSVRSVAQSLSRKYSFLYNGKYDDKVKSPETDEDVLYAYRRHYKQMTCYDYCDERFPVFPFDGNFRFIRSTLRMLWKVDMQWLTEILSSRVSMGSTPIIWTESHAKSPVSGRIWNVTRNTY